MYQIHTMLLFFYAEMKVMFFRQKAM